MFSIYVVRVWIEMVKTLPSIKIFITFDSVDNFKLVEKLVRKRETCNYIRVKREKEKNIDTEIW